MSDYYVHPSAEVSDGAKIGDGTKIWHQAQVRENTVVGENVNVGKCAYIDEGVKVGDNVKIQNRVSLYKGVTVEDDVFLGPHVAFTNDFRPRAFTKEFEVVDTAVRKGASVGANSTIICGIEIGEYAMVGAGSVVTKDVEPHLLVYGNPAKPRGVVCRCGQKLESGREEDGKVKFKCGCGQQTIISMKSFNSIGDITNQ